MSDTSPATSKLQRIAKGPKPQYFADPATDKLLTMVLELTQELSVARDRIDTLERLIEAAGIFPTSAVEMYQPPEAVAAARSERRDAMLARVFRASEKELDQAVGKGKPLAPEEIDDILS